MGKIIPQPPLKRGVGGMGAGYYEPRKRKNAKEEGERMRSHETLLNFTFQNSTLRRLVID